MRSAMTNDYVQPFVTELRATVHGIVSSLESGDGGVRRDLDPALDAFAQEAIKHFLGEAYRNHEITPQDYAHLLKKLDDA